MELTGTIPHHHHRALPLLRPLSHRRPTRVSFSLSNPTPSLRTCRNCKKQYDPSTNTAAACLHHTAHYGGETRRKFESVHTGGTMDTPEGGKVEQYWHCCGEADPFHPGCTAAPHASFDTS